MDNNKYANAKQTKIIYRFFIIFYCCELVEINVVPKEYLMYTVYVQIRFKLMIL
jgi:hypothetical protein